MKMESMSKNIVDVMFELSKNAGLAMLLVNDFSDPFSKLHKPIDGRTLIKPDASTSKIFPYPFDPEATTLDGSFIRVYYNEGEFNSNEVIAESQLNIDIIVSKSLWLINDSNQELTLPDGTKYTILPENTRSLIRPYEIMGRVIDIVGRRSNNKTIRLNFDGYQHLYVNTKFDCIRLYSNYFSVET